MVSSTLIKNILNTNKNFSVLSDYFSLQERDRFAEVLETALVSAEVRSIPSANFKDWAELVRPYIVKEIENTTNYFGFKDLLHRFSVDSFLEEYYKTNSDNK